MYDIKAMKRDSNRALFERALRKFDRTWTFFFLMLLLLPFFMLWRASKRRTMFSIMLTIGLLVIPSLYA